MSESIMNFRVNKELKTAFEMVAKNNDLTSSQMLRAFMRETVEDFMRKNAQKSLLEPLKVKTNTKTKAKQKSVIPDAWRAK